MKLSSTNTSFLFFIIDLSFVAQRPYWPKRLWISLCNGAACKHPAICRGVLELRLLALSFAGLLDELKQIHNYGLSRAPILVVQLRSVSRGNRAHICISFPSRILNIAFATPN